MKLPYIKHVLNIIIPSYVSSTLLKLVKNACIQQTLEYVIQHVYAHHTYAFILINVSKLNVGNYSHKELQRRQFLGT